MLKSNHDLPQGVGVLASQLQPVNKIADPTLHEKLEYLVNSLNGIDSLSTAIRSKMFGSYPQNNNDAPPVNCLDDIITHAVLIAEEIHSTLQYVNQRIN